MNNKCTLCIKNIAKAERKQLAGEQQKKRLPATERERERWIKRGGGGAVRNKMRKTDDSREEKWIAALACLLARTISQGVC